jgi:hypothetical protein
MKLSIDVMMHFKKSPKLWSSFKTLPHIDQYSWAPSCKEIFFIWKGEQGIPTHPWIVRNHFMEMKFFLKRELFRV